MYVFGSRRCGWIGGEWITEFVFLKFFLKGVHRELYLNT